MSESCVAINDRYLERRFAQADEDAARVAMLAAQSARRQIAIEEALRRLDALKREHAAVGYSQESMCELLTEIAAHLELANKQRADDPTAEEVAAWA